jgi:phospholipid/cholesterol/gamma-HCH transport system ATP-binding protein
MSDPCVICENLAVGHDETIVVSGVNFSVQPGGITAVVGPSGCGKSTLLRALSGLAAPIEGRSLLLGVDLATAKDAERGAVLRRTGFLFQSSALWSSLTLRENVELPLLEFAGVGPREARILAEHKLAQVGLLNAADKLPTEMDFPGIMVDFSKPTSNRRFLV